MPKSCFIPVAICHQSKNVKKKNTYVFYIYASISAFYHYVFCLDIFYLVLCDCCVCEQVYIFVYVLTDTNCPLSLPDIAVGAPYADSGSGRVYIYHGSAYGINTKPAQVKSYFPLLLPLSESLPYDSAASLYSDVYGLS